MIKLINLNKVRCVISVLIIVPSPLINRINHHTFSRIWGSHCGQYEDGCLLGCSAVKSGRSISTFQRSLLPLSSGRSGLIALMMETANTSETLVYFYQTTRRYNPEDSHHHVFSLTSFSRHSQFGIRTTHLDWHRFHPWFYIQGRLYPLCRQ
jgi:hypothetical protein